MGIFLTVGLPDRVHRGSIPDIAAHSDIAVHALPAQAKTSIFHAEVLNPQGKKMVFYSGNIIANSGGVRSIPLAVNDPIGTWTITVHDIMSGQSVTRHLNVE